VEQAKQGRLLSFKKLDLWVHQQGVRGGPTGPNGLISAKPLHLMSNHYRFGCTDIGRVGGHLGSFFVETLPEEALKLFTKQVFGTGHVSARGDLDGKVEVAQLRCDVGDNSCGIDCDLRHLFNEE